MPSTATQLDRRVTVLERQLRKMRSELRVARRACQEPWWKRLAGKFKNDPLFDETIKAGKAYRRSLAGRKR
jgi:hypothetical protein